MRTKLEHFLVSLLSRKFLLAVIASVFVACNFIFHWGLSKSDIAAVLAPLGAFMLAEGTADVVSRSKGPASADFSVVASGEDLDDGVMTGSGRVKPFDELSDDQ